MTQPARLGKATDGLTARQRRFVDLYIVSGNATQAYIDAGFSPKGDLEELCRLRDLAKASKQYGAAIQAEIKRGEAAGFYIKRRENIKPTMSPEQLEARVCDLLRITPEQLRAMQAARPTLRVLSEAGSKP
jgi:phage terminase small subunit